MRNIIVLLLFVPTYLAGQLEVTLTIENQFGNGTDFFFDIFLTRTSSGTGGDVYLGNSDFVLNFNDANFQSPAIVKEGSSPGFNNFKPTDSNPTNDLITQINYYDNATANIINNQIVINLLGPSPGDEPTFNSRVAKIDGSSSIHRLGRFRITGISNPIGTADLNWQTTGNGLRTKVQSLEHMSPFNSAEINVVAVNPPNAALPIHLVSFQVVIIDNQKAKLIWETASEINNEGFDIERKNGPEWIRIGFVKGQGTSSLPHSYEFVDQSPFAGINFYRLAQIDFDGTIHHSHIESLTFTNEAKIKVFPNPVSNLLFVHGSVKRDYRICDGRGIWQMSGLLESGSIDVSSLSAGIYILFIDSQPIKFIKW